MARICPRCGSDIPVDHRLCPVCLFGEGLKLQTVRCLKCQAEVDDGARFCSECGTATPSAPTVEGDAIRSALEAKLKGQYRVIRLLGRGGMGAVYLARDLALEREVAIKVVKTAEEQSYDRFRREARTAAKLSHPNIVPLHAFGEVEGMPYFVMGYVRGESLAARLRRDGKLPDDEARRIVADLAEALDHAHRQGVVHRDVKPDNVLLDDESGRALLTDFGVAKALGRSETLTAVGSVVGTPSYMSPEQAAGRADIDGRSDIYSLGVMAYAMLTGRLPFEGKTAADVLTKHLTQQPPPLGLTLVGGGFALVYGMITALLVREGLSIGQSQRVIWTEPSWWPLWYPRGLRRRGNVWDRLPAAVRRVRTWPAAFLALGVLGQSDALFHVLDWRGVPPPPPPRVVFTRAGPVRVLCGPLVCGPRAVAGPGPGAP